MNVIIKSYSGKDRYGDFEEFTEVVVNGESISIEVYGGEPEDNSRCRDYKWVEPLLLKLAKKLGAEAKIEIHEGLPKGW